MTIKILIFLLIIGNAYAQTSMSWEEGGDLKCITKDRVAEVSKSYTELWKYGQTK